MAPSVFCLSPFEAQQKIVILNIQPIFDLTEGKNMFDTFQQIPLGGLWPDGGASTLSLLLTIHLLTDSRMVWVPSLLAGDRWTASWLVSWLASLCLSTRVGSGREHHSCSLALAYVSCEWIYDSNKNCSWVRGVSQFGLSFKTFFKSLVPVSVSPVSPVFKTFSKLKF